MLNKYTSVNKRKLYKSSEQKLGTENLYYNSRLTPYRIQIKFV